MFMYITVFAAIAIVATQVKQRYAKRIMEAQARGKFADLEMPKNKSRFRLLAGLALFSILGFTCSLGVFALQSFRDYMSLEPGFSNFHGITIVAGLIFGGIGATTGFLMQREINRRL